RDTRVTFERRSANSCRGLEARLAQPRCEGAVGAVTLRQHAQQAVVQRVRRHHTLRRRLERPVRMLTKKSVNLRVVFLQLERAGAVDQQSTWAHGMRRGLENRALQRGK